MKITKELIMLKIANDNGFDSFDELLKSNKYKQSTIDIFIALFFLKNTKYFYSLQ